MDKKEQDIEVPNKKKRIPLTRARKTMAVAAMFILVIGAAAAINLLLPKQEAAVIGGNEDTEGKKLKGLTTAKNYQEVYTYMKRNRTNNMSDAKMAESKTSNEVTAYESAKQTGIAEDAAGGYSKTNVRQEGVDEADIVKTDGAYLYSLKDNREEIAVIDPAENRQQKP